MYWQQSDRKRDESQEALSGGKLDTHQVAFIIEQVDETAS